VDESKPLPHIMATARVQPPEPSLTLTGNSDSLNQGLTLVRYSA
jgi:hypothetical protein